MLRHSADLPRTERTRIITPKAIIKPAPDTNECPVISETRRRMARTVVVLVQERGELTLRRLSVGDTAGDQKRKTSDEIKDEKNQKKNFIQSHCRRFFLRFGMTKRMKVDAFSYSFRLSILNDDKTNSDVIRKRKEKTSMITIDIENVDENVRRESEETPIVRSGWKCGEKRIVELR